MTISQYLILGVIFIPLILVISGRLRMDIASISIMTLLASLQLLGFNVFGPQNEPDLAIRALSGFSQDAIIILTAIFILTSALEKSGLTSWISEKILKLGGNSLKKLIFLFSCTAAFLSLFMNDIAAGALLIPSVMEVCRQTKINPGKLLIPVSFGSLLGGMATYFATANILASMLLKNANPPQKPLGILDFFLTGGLIAISGILFMTFFGDRFLPQRGQAAFHENKKLTGSELEKVYGLPDRTWHAVVDPESPIIGLEINEIGFGEKYGLLLAALRDRNNQYLIPKTNMKINEKDHLLIIGREERILKLTKLGIRIRENNKNKTLSKRGLVLFEILPMLRSGLLGKTLKDLDFRHKFGLSVIALRRGESNYRTDVGNLRLQFGDSLLVLGERDRIELVRDNRDLMVLESSLMDQPLKKKETILSIGLLFAAVTAASFGVPIYIAILIASLLIIFSGIVSIQDAYNTIEWPVIFSVGSMYCISLALVESGIAEIAGSFLVSITSVFGQLGLAGAGFMIASFLSQIMGGQFEMMVTGPIAISAAIQYGINPQAVALAIALGCSNSFLTPMAHPVNLLMMGPGGYKFSDFPRLGWWIFLLSFIMLLVGLIIFWGF